MTDKTKEQLITELMNHINGYESTDKSEFINELLLAHDADVVQQVAKRQGINLVTPLQLKLRYSRNFNIWDFDSDTKHDIDEDTITEISAITSVLCDEDGEYLYDEVPTNYIATINKYLMDATGYPNIEIEIRYSIL